MSDSKISVLIVEDEFSIAMDIEMRLKKMGYYVSGIANTYKDALSLLLEKHVDIVLLDINLNSKKSGIDLAEIINTKFDIPIVFITAYSDQKTFSEALEHNPMGFITKPFKDADLNNNIQIAIKKFNLKNNNTNTPEFKIYDNNLFIKDKGVYKKLNIDDIIWTEAMDNYTIIHTEKEKFIVNAFLRDVINKLGNNFIRIHRSHAVALNKVSTIEDNVVYVGKTMLICSQTYKQELLKKLTIL